MAEPLRVGLIGLDNSHVVAFTELLNDPAAPHHVAGARVVAAYPGGSRDIELSHSRVAGFTAELRDQHGIAILDTPQAVAEASDLVFLGSIDGRVHLEQLRQTLPFRRPTFVDKPIATRSSEAEEMFRLAEQAGVPLMSASALPYADNLVELLKPSPHGKILGCDLFGPMTELPEPPGLFFYGIHLVETALKVMGGGCVEVCFRKNPDHELGSARWSDGRMVSFRGMRKGHRAFGITLHREKGYQQADLSANPRPLYVGLLEAILRSLPAGRSDVPKERTLDVIRFLEAANRSRETGEPVTLG